MVELSFSSPRAELGIEDGKKLVAIARRALSRYLKHREIIKPVEAGGRLNQTRPVFVILRKSPGRQMRGCLGYSIPPGPIASSVIEAAICAATSDPRFPPLSLQELEKTVIEVSVLTHPEPMELADRKGLPNAFVPGRQGLLLERGINEAILLPEFAAERRLSSKQFLEALCEYAGLEKSAWLDSKTVISRFDAVSFEEKEPGGEVVERKVG